MPKYNFVKASQLQKELTSKESDFVTIDLVRGRFTMSYYHILKHKLENQKIMFYIDRENKYIGWKIVKSLFDIKGSRTIKVKYTKTKSPTALSIIPYLKNMKLSKNARAGRYVVETVQLDTGDNTSNTMYLIKLDNYA